MPELTLSPTIKLTELRYTRIVFLIGLAVSVVLTVSCQNNVPLPPKVEARAVWLHRFEYTSTTSTYSADTIRSYIESAIDRAAAAQFNIVFFQIRGSADAYYTPGLEPWGELLTGEVGKDPGWDPLAFALEKAHAHGLELHAWINTFPAWRGKEPPLLTDPPSPYLMHPEWVIADSAGLPMQRNSGYVSFSPGIPAVQEHIIAVTNDIISRYEVDGIHFDYIRYPEDSPIIGYSHDSISVARFESTSGNPYDLDWDDWQREQLTQFVAEMYNAIKANRPEVKVSAAVIGSYKDSKWNAYNVVYQDPRRWSELGKIDFILPMIYWPRNHPTQPFMIRANEWQQDYTLDRLVFPGIASYRYNTEDEDMTWAEAQGQIDDIRVSGINGMAFFDARSLALHWEELGKNRFSRPALIPSISWSDSIAPGAPEIVDLRKTNTMISLVWTPPDDSDVTRYAIYSSFRLPVLQNGENLIDITSGPRLFADIEARWKNRYVAISAIDEAWNEGPLSAAAKVSRTD